MRSWGAGLAGLIGVSLLLVGCGGGASSSQPRRYSTRQVERAFATVGIKLGPAHFNSDLAGPSASAFTKIRQALTLLPGNQPVSIVHLHIARSPSFTPFSSQEVERTFKDAGIPLRVRPVNRSAFLKVLFGASHGGPYDLRWLVPRKELEAAVPLHRHDHLLIIVSSRVNPAEPLIATEGSGQESPEDDGIVFNVYFTWHLTLPSRQQKVEIAIKRLQEIADARTAIAIGA